MASDLFHSDLEFRYLYDHHDHDVGHDHDHVDNDIDDGNKSGCPEKSLIYALKIYALDINICMVVNINV